VPQIRAVAEDSVDETIGSSVDLTLREWPQLDRLHPPWKRIRQRMQPHDPRRPRQQELAGQRSRVDPGLDRKEKLWESLDLVDDHRLRPGDELPGVLAGRLTDIPVVEGVPLRVPTAAPDCKPAAGQPANLPTGWLQICRSW